MRVSQFPGKLGQKPASAVRNHTMPKLESFDYIFVADTMCNAVGSESYKNICHYAVQGHSSSTLRYQSKAGMQLAISHRF